MYSFENIEIVWRTIIQIEVTAPDFDMLVLLLLFPQLHHVNATSTPTHGNYLDAIDLKQPMEEGIKFTNCKSVCLISL